MSLKKFTYPVNEEIKENIQRDFKGGEGCVYIVRCIDPDTGSPLPVSKVGGIDHDGVLYIGMSKNALSRPLKVNWSLLDPSRPGANHDAGLRYNNNQKLLGLFPKKTFN